MATAMQLAQAHAAKETVRLAKISGQLIERLSGLRGVSLNANNKWRLASHINISVANRASDELLIACDRLGLAVSAASACSSGSIGPSYVLAALHKTKKAVANTSSLRISLGRLTTQREGEQIAKILTKVISI